MRNSEIYLRPDSREEKGKVGDYSGIKAKQAQQNWQIEKGQGGNDYDCQVVAS